MFCHLFMVHSVYSVVGFFFTFQQHAKLMFLSKILSSSSHWQRGHEIKWPRVRPDYRHVQQSTTRCEACCIASNSNQLNSTQFIDIWQLWSWIEQTQRTYNVYDSISRSYKTQTYPRLVSLQPGRWPSSIWLRRVHLHARANSALKFLTQLASCNRTKSNCD